MTPNNIESMEKDFWTEMNTGEQEKFVLETKRLKKDISFGVKLSTPPHKQTSMENKVAEFLNGRCTGAELEALIGVIKYELSLALETQRREMVDKVAGLKKPDMGPVKISYEHGEKDGYNEALSDILALLQNNLTK